MARSAALASTCMCALTALVAGCGGGGGGGGGGTPPPNPPASGWVAGTFLPAATYAGRCANPRSGTNPANNMPYVDVQGQALDENNWLRSYSNDLYLWYEEIVDRDPGLYATLDYFNQLKTPATTASGRPKDRFHFTYRTDEWLALSQSGIQAGYGLEWAVAASTPPRSIRVAYTNPGTPATQLPAPIERGETVLTADGVDLVNGNTQAIVDTFVAALYPDGAGETHTFTLRHPRTGNVRSVTLQSAVVSTAPVQNVRTLTTLTGTVGYLTFNDHLATAEQQLVTAFNTLRTAGVSDLVIDLRYNGGGYLAIASQLAYMIAGPARTAGQTFERIRFNAKHTSINPVTGQPLTPDPFHDQTLGFSAPQGQPLPTLNLSRVFLLTGGSTCSASESLINGLRGVNVDVIQIGSTTCGKPYGFYSKDNCGTTYFTIQLTGVNAKGFGEYGDGFTPINSSATYGERVPGCSVRDDFDHALGDIAEERLAAALAYRVSALSCPVPSGIGKQHPSKLFGSIPIEAAADAVVVKSPWLQNRTFGVP
jgi:carboxyl-terminal processing protease